MTSTDEDINIEDVVKWYTRPYDVKERNGFIIEDFIGNEMSISNIAVKYKVSEYTVTRAIELYWLKPETELILSSKV